jgi:hypothetical protein
MAAETIAGSKVLEDVFQNVRRAAESSLKMHQEIFHQWTHMWPFPTPQSVWIDKARDFQKQFAVTVSDLARKHREVVDKQFQAGIESLDAALRVAEATNPEEYRRRTEQLCRKTLDSMREISETQLSEFQDAVMKCTELFTKSDK